MDKKKFRDFQRQRVYDWEEKHVGPHDQSHVPYDQIQSIVDYIWNDLGLSYPPQVVPLHKGNKWYGAKADRFQLHCPEGGLSTWVILHELAHSLTCDFEQISVMHGPRFVGVYIDLLVKYMGMDRIMLLGSAKANKVQVSFEGHIIG